MTTYQQKDGTGALFKNPDKAEGDSKPNAKGTALIAGVSYWVSAWTNTTKDGQKYQALKFEPKEARQTTGRKRETEAPPF